MRKYKGLENDISYIKYKQIIKEITEEINKEDINTTYLSILVKMLDATEKDLNKVKEYRDGENRNIDTEVRESN